MIIKRTRDVYWLSKDLGLDKKTLDPKVPKNFLVSGGGIDKTTKRIQLYDSLDDAISVYGLGGKNLSGEVLGVYKPKILRPSFRLSPALEDCPYRNTLDRNEYWCLIPIVLEKIADIRIDEKTETRKFRYGGRRQKAASVLSAELSRYSWTEILPEWDKKGKTKKL